MTRWRAGLAGLLLAAVAAACTGEPEPTPVRPTVAALAPSDTNAQPRDAVGDGGIVRLRLPGIPTQWNPDHPDADRATLLPLLAPLTAPAFSLDPAGRASANPDVVTGVEVTDTDRTRVTLTLHPAARWGDGEPVTAADWIATWRARTGQVAGVEATAGEDGAGWDAVERVEAGATDHHVVVHYRGIEPDWAEPLVAGPWRARAVADAAAFDWSSFDPGRHAGPFTITHVDETQGVVTLDPNPRWWGDPPRLAHVVYRTLPDDAAPAAFRHNELDVLHIGRSEVFAEKVRGATDTVVRAGPAASGRLLVLAEEGRLADVAVRRAVLASIDRAALARAEVGALGVEPTLWSDPVLLPNQPGYADQARATGLAFDPARAADELEAAGWVRGADGVRVRDGVRLTLTFAVHPADPLAADEFAAVAADLADAGIGLQPAVTPATADLTPATEAVGAFPLARLPRAASAPDLADYVARISTTTDPVRRADQANQLSRLLWQGATRVPLYQEPELVGVRAGLANLGAGGFATTHWEDVGWQR